MERGLDEGKDLAKVVALIERNTPAAQRRMAFYVHQRFGGPLTPAEKQRRYRDRKRDQVVTENGNADRDQKVTAKRDQVVTPPSSSTTSFLRYYSEQFEQAFKEKPNVNYAKDGAISKKLLAQYGEEKLQGLLLEFFSSQDDFILKTGYTIGVFSSVLNKLLTSKRSRKRTLSAREIWDEAQREKEAER